MPALGDYRDREHWSFSSLNQFMNICSLQWAFQRLYHLPSAFTPVSLIFGSVFHEVMDHAAACRLKGEVFAPEAAADLFGDLWQARLNAGGNIRYEGGHSAGDYLLQGQAASRCALEGMDPDERVVSFKEAFAVPLTAHGVQVSSKPLIGELDLVVEKDGQRLVVDYKTSARRWPKGQASRSLQPSAYLYAYRQLHGMDVAFRFDVLVKNKTPLYERHLTTRGPDDFERLAVMAERIEAMVQAEHFLPAEQGFYCGGCPYTAPCRVWHRGSCGRTRAAA